MKIHMQSLPSLQLQVQAICVSSLQTGAALIQAFYYIRVKQELQYETYAYNG